MKKLTEKKTKEVLREDNLNSTHENERYLSVVCFFFFEEGEKEKKRTIVYACEDKYEYVLVKLF